MKNFIDDFADKLLISGLASWWNIKGCSEREVEILENHFEIKTPLIYRDFLLRMGKKAGNFLQGTDFFYNDLFGNRRALEEVLEGDENPILLSLNDFVFSCHQGYIYHFFNVTDDLFDPPIYLYVEGEFVKQSVEAKFSTFLLTALEEEKKFG